MEGSQDETKMSFDFGHHRHCESTVKMGRETNVRRHSFCTRCRWNDVILLTTGRSMTPRRDARSPYTENKWFNIIYVRESRPLAASIARRNCQTPVDSSSLRYFSYAVHVPIGSWEPSTWRRTMVMFVSWLREVAVVSRSLASSHLAQLTTIRLPVTFKLRSS